MKTIGNGGESKQIKTVGEGLINRSITEPTPIIEEEPVDAKELTEPIVEEPIIEEKPKTESIKAAPLAPPKKKEAPAPSKRGRPKGSKNKR